MEEIEYLEEYEEIVMPQLLHNAIEEFLPPDDPYDLLPVDPAFDEFIEEDPLCSVYRNEFQFETTQTSNNNVTGPTISVPSSKTNSIVTVHADNVDGGDGSTILTDEISQYNVIVEQSETATTNTLIDSDHQLQCLPSDVETTTYDHQQQNNIGIDDIELQNNSDNNIIYDTNYVRTSPEIIKHNFVSSDVKVLSCETLGTSVFLNSTSLTTPAITENPAAKSKYFSPIQSINDTNLFVSAQPQQFASTMYEQNSSLQPKNQSVQKGTSNHSKKLSTNYKNNNFQSELLALKCSLRPQNSSDKFKSNLINKISDNVRRFIKKSPTNKSSYIRCLDSVENDIIAVSASSLEGSNFKFLFTSKDIPSLKLKQHKNNTVDCKNDATKGSLKQYTEMQKFYEDSQNSDESLTNYDISRNQKDKKYVQKCSNESTDENLPLKATNYRQSINKMPLNDSQTMAQISETVDSVPKRNSNNKDVNLILAKNTSLKSNQSNSLTAFKKSDFNNDNSSNKYRNIIKSRFPTSIRKEQARADENELKAISVSGNKKFNLCKKSPAIPDSSIDELDGKKTEEYSSPTRTNKGRTTNDVLSSPKELRVVVPRTPELASPNNKLNNVEEPIILGSKNDTKEQDQLVDLTDDVDPLKLDDDEIKFINKNKISNLENTKNYKKYQKCTAPATEFESFATEQKLKNYKNANKIYSEFRKSEIELSKLGAITEFDEKSNNKTSKNIDTLNKNEINNSNDSKTTKNNENSSKRNNKNINQKSKTVVNIQDNSITSNAIDNNEIETKMSEIFNERFPQTTSVEETKSLKQTEIVRNKRLASRNQSSTESRPSNLKDTFVDDKEVSVQEDSHLASRSRGQFSRNSVDKQPALDFKTSIITEPKDLKSVKDGPVSGSGESRRRRTVPIKNTVNKTSKIKNDNKNIVSPEMESDNISNNLSNKVMKTQQLSSYNEEKLSKDKKTKKEIEEPTEVINFISKHCDAKQTESISEDTDVLAPNLNVNEETKKIEKNCQVESKEIEMGTKKKVKNTKRNVNYGKEVDKITNKSHQESKKDGNKNENIEKETSNKNKIIDNQNSIQIDFENLSTIGDNVTKPLHSEPPSTSNYKEKALKAAKRQSRELKQLKIDDNTPRIFIEPTSNTRLSRSRSKRSGGQKSAAKIIRRRQSNILQISRKEYDRVVSERRAKPKIPDTPPILIPFEVNEVQQENSLKLSPNQKEKIKNNIKPCKVVLERIQVLCGKTDILTASKKLFSGSTLRGKNDNFVKENKKVDEDNSSQKVNIDSNPVASTTKKRTLNNSYKQVEPKIMKISDILENVNTSTDIGIAVTNATNSNFSSPRQVNKTKSSTGEISQISEHSEKMSKKLSKHSQKIHLSPKFLSLKIDKRNKDGIKDIKEKQLNSTPRCGFKEGDNSSNSYSDMELTKKRKISGSVQIINDDIKKSKLSSPNDNKTAKSNEISNLGIASTSNTSTKLIVPSQINSKPQIFIAAPGNLSRHNNSDSNIRENNSKDSTTINSNLDFSIESWFQKKPPSSSTQVETSTAVNSTEKNLLLKQTSIPTTTATTTVRITNSQFCGTSNSYWSLPSSTHIQSTQSSQITCTPPSALHISNIKSVNIPANIVVQTKFLTREQYMSKFKNPPTTNISASNILTPTTNNNLISGTSNSGIIDNKNQHNSSVKILEKIANLLETQIDSEVRHKIHDLIENKTIEDQLRTERLTNIKKIGYTSDFSLQILVFLQNYFFNTSTVKDNMKNVYNICDSDIRNSEKQLPTESPNTSLSNEDFSFRKIRLPAQNNNINNDSNKNKLLNNRTSLKTQVNKNAIIGVYKDKYFVTGGGTILLNNKELQNNKSTKLAKLVSCSSDVFQSDTNVSQTPKKMSSDTLNDSTKMPSLTLRQISSKQGELINTVFLNSINNTCEAGITTEPESILPDDCQTIAPPLFETEIKEEDIEESIIS